MALSGFPFSLRRLPFILIWIPKVEKVGLLLPLWGKVGKGVRN
jgi:hypothetical protein